MHREKYFSNRNAKKFLHYCFVKTSNKFRRVIRWKHLTMVTMYSRAHYYREYYKDTHLDNHRCPKIVYKNIHGDDHAKWDIAVLQIFLKDYNMQFTDTEVCNLYSDFSTIMYCAGWMRITDNTIISFLDWVCSPPYTGSEYGGAEWYPKQERFFK